MSEIKACVNLRILLSILSTRFNGKLDAFTIFAQQGTIIYRNPSHYYHKSTHAHNITQGICCIGSTQISSLLLTLYGSCSVDMMTLSMMEPVGHWSPLDTPLLDIQNVLEQLSLVEHLQWKNTNSANIQANIQQVNIQYA